MGRAKRGIAISPQGRQLIRQKRLEKGMTQEELAKTAGFGDKKTISNIERGPQESFDEDTLIRVTRALDLTLEDILNPSTTPIVLPEPSPWIEEADVHEDGREKSAEAKVTPHHRVSWSLVVIIFLVLCLIVESVTLVVVTDRLMSRPIVSSNMVLIPAGEFQMGSVDGDDDEKPTHPVYLDAFYIDVCEVTNEDYKRFMDDTGHPAPQYWKDDRFNAPDQPVVGVSWYDAAAYCQWAGRRLPTEAEWEKAARGELVGKKYPWGDSIDPKRANYGRNVGRTSPVGTYPPNGYGLYDMAGNVWEWCMDEMDGSFYQKPFDPKNPVSGPFIRFDNQDFTHFTKDHVLRGGCWHNPEGDLRVAQRNGDTSRNTNYLFGFRTARAVGATRGKLREEK
ncbi:SUMF1/EgtB/PvdO family nonheme iron enzyme [Candidatus Poribacteria bacterium]|nr:SUMF1/EgtB/PvdO family nonheme iron enzyme [Candidatus Poribacteria bacterium]